ncbi:MAG: hypothetical protein MI976_31885 [Pseudomonadales bacterium]|nr:hypothetical protein [Pseudomonadales bacterium]
MLGKHFRSNFLPLLLLSFLLTGCNLSVKVIGEGTVYLQESGKSCTDKCIEYSKGTSKTERLTAEPADGYDFLGFAVHYNVRYALGLVPDFSYKGFYIEEPEDEIGYGLILDNSWGDTIPITSNVKVQAIFYPSNDILQIDDTYKSICVLNQQHQAKCWGNMAKHALDRYEYVDQVFTESGYVQSNICVIAENKLQCWNDEDDFPWTIPQEIKNPIAGGFGLNQVCALHKSGNTNQVTCFNSSGHIILDTPELENPTNFHADNRNRFCVDDLDETICWGGQ